MSNWCCFINDTLYVYTCMKGRGSGIVKMITPEAVSQTCYAAIAFGYFWSTGSSWCKHKQGRKDVKVYQQHIDSVFISHYMKNRALNVNNFIYALSFCLPKQSGQRCSCPEGHLSAIIALLAGHAPNCFSPSFWPFKHEFHDLDLRVPQQEFPIGNASAILPLSWIVALNWEARKCICAWSSLLFDYV